MENRDNELNLVSSAEVDPNLLRMLDRGIDDALLPVFA